MYRTDLTSNKEDAQASIAWDFVSDRLAGSPVHLFFRAGQCADAIFAQEMRKNGLTPRQYAVLVTIVQNEGLSQNNLAKRTGIDRSTLSNIVRRLLNKGLLSRQRRQEDARTSSITLTNAGLQAIQIADPIAARIDNRILSLVSAKQRKQFMIELAAMVKLFSFTRSKMETFLRAV